MIREIAVKLLFVFCAHTKNRTRKHKLVAQFFTPKISVLRVIACNWRCTALDMAAIAISFCSVLSVYSQFSLWLSRFGCENNQNPILPIYLPLLTNFQFKSQCERVHYIRLKCLNVNRTHFNGSRTNVQQFCALSRGNAWTTLVLVLLQYSQEQRKNIQFDLSVWQTGKMAYKHWKLKQNLVYRMNRKKRLLFLTLNEMEI